MSILSNSEILEALEEKIDCVSIGFSAKTKVSLIIDSLCEISSPCFTFPYAKRYKYWEQILRNYDKNENMTSEQLLSWFLEQIIQPEDFIDDITFRVIQLFHTINNH